jgi:hypothetical protein
MLYTPMPGTELFRQIAADGRLRTDIDLADTHGQFKFNFHHPAISRDESKTLLDSAFRLDFERNGPSLFRLMHTMMVRWRCYHDDPDPRVRARVEVAATQLRSGYGAALWAMERYLRKTNPEVSARIRALRLETEHEFGIGAAVLNRLLGPVLRWSSSLEARRYPGGRPREPRTFIERREAAPSTAGHSLSARQTPNPAAMSALGVQART